jgi:putative lipoprotein
MTDDREILLKGRIVFPAEDRPAEAARVVARVEDASRADAPARTVAQQVQERVAIPQAESESLSFAISYPASADPPGGYRVRVHVDVTGTSTVTPGDFVSTISYPVPSEQDEKQDEMAVTVRRV